VAPSKPDDRLASAKLPGERALRWHPFYRGKIQTALKCPVRGAEDLAVWYTPGVAASCRAIRDDPAQVWEQTNRANLIAVVSDGTRVLGLGNIGPEAGLPVMEGKALLFKYLGGVDAVPLCLGTRDADELVRTVELLAPSFGGINLEDIEQPKCFEVLDRLRERMPIPVWHDDQQGTATVTLAGLLNALEIVGKSLTKVRIALIGAGAANVANFRLLRAAGVDPTQIVACDSRGTLGPHRDDLSRERERRPQKWTLCCETNPERVVGGIAEALRGADVCLAFSTPGPELIAPEWIRAMADDAIVFACANPTPEIWPWVASEAGARIVATGRGDFANQVNNSLGFPGIFRGTLDVRARSVSEPMALAAARELAGFARERGISEASIVPRMDEWEVFPRVAAAVGEVAIATGLAKRTASRDELLAEATTIIAGARRSLEALREGGVIVDPPADPE
jgi:malate dehydrogenase (oxaloacetate-decarboxylating)